jgi:hypothetical protein
LDRECDGLKARNAELEQELATVRQEAIEAAQAGAPDFLEALKHLLPRLDILPESFGYLSIGIQDRGVVLDLLAKLNQDPGLILHKSTKKVEEAPEWHERHFSTGRDRDGRLYYSSPTASGKRLVLLAPKRDPKEQSRLIKRLGMIEI